MRYDSKELEKRKYLVFLMAVNDYRANDFHPFWDGDNFFTMKGAKEYVKFIERLYPENKGLYKIFKCEEANNNGWWENKLYMQKKCGTKKRKKHTGIIAKRSNETSMERTTRNQGDKWWQQDFVSKKSVH